MRLSVVTASVVHRFHCWPLASPSVCAPTVRADELEEIVVTATRQARLLSTVPISASAFSQKTLDAQGVKQIDDIALITPGVTFYAGQ